MCVRPLCCLDHGDCKAIGEVAICLDPISPCVPSGTHEPRCDRIGWVTDDPPRPITRDWYVGARRTYGIDLLLIERLSIFPLLDRNELNRPRIAAVLIDPRFCADPHKAVDGSDADLFAVEILRRAV